MAHLPMKWAEREDRLLITVEASNATNVDIQFTENTISISGSGVTAKNSEAHELKDTLKLLGTIDPAASTFKALGVSIQICAIKKDKGFWSRLVDEPTKNTKNWLSVDWNLWKDEDDNEQEGISSDFGGYGDMASMLGGMGGMGGMGGLGDMGGLGGMEGDDSDDEEGEEPANLDDLKE